jgi:hypothetical protein
MEGSPIPGRMRLSPWALAFACALVALIFGLFMAPVAYFTHGGWGWGMMGGMRSGPGWYTGAPVIGLLSFLVISGLMGLLVGWFYNLALDWRNR